MQAQYVHDGKHVDFTPDVDVPIGSIVIQGDLVGITKRDLKADVLGSIAVGYCPVEPNEPTWRPFDRDRDRNRDRLFDRTPGGRNALIWANAGELATLALIVVSGILLGFILIKRGM